MIFTWCKKVILVAKNRWKNGGRTPGKIGRQDSGKEPVKPSPLIQKLLKIPPPKVSRPTARQGSLSLRPPVPLPPYNAPRPRVNAQGIPREPAGLPPTLDSSFRAFSDAARRAGSSLSDLVNSFVAGRMAGRATEQRLRINRISFGDSAAGIPVAMEYNGPSLDQQVRWEPTINIQNSPMSDEAVRLLQSRVAAAMATRVDMDMLGLSQHIEAGVPDATQRAINMEAMRIQDEMQMRMSSAPPVRLDGVRLNPGDRVLIRGQPATVQNTVLVVPRAGRHTIELDRSNGEMRIAESLPVNLRDRMAYLRSYTPTTLARSIALSQEVIAALRAARADRHPVSMERARGAAVLLPRGSGVLWDIRSLEYEFSMPWAWRFIITEDIRASGDEDGFFDHIQRMVDNSLEEAIAEVYEFLQLDTLEIFVPMEGSSPRTYFVPKDASWEVNRVGSRQDIQVDYDDTLYTHFAALFMHPEESARDLVQRGMNHQFNDAYLTAFNVYRVRRAEQEMARDRLNAEARTALARTATFAMRYGTPMNVSRVLGEHGQMVQTRTPSHPDTGKVINTGRLQRSVSGIEVHTVRQADGTVMQKPVKPGAQSLLEISFKRRFTK